jgi:hypothetical protein
LGIYNVTSADLDTLEDLNNRFESRLPSYRVSVSGRKAENENLHSFIKSGLQLVKEQLGRMMVRYETAKPTFYAAYLNAVKVVDYGTRYEKLEEPVVPTPQPVR